MSKKFLLLAALVLIGFVYWCGTQQNTPDVQCVDNSDCNQEIISADSGKKTENSDIENEDEVSIAGDNDGPMWWVTISSLDEEL